MSDKKGSTKGKGIGGQAIIEGVMMRGHSVYSMAVRHPEKGILIETKPIAKNGKKAKILKLPLIRGVVNFFDSLVVGMKVTMRSAEMSGMEELEYDKSSKFEMWLEKKFGDKLSQYIVYFSVIISIILSVGLFFILPTLIGGWISKGFNDSTSIRSVAESVVKIIIFLGYMLLISLMKDVKRTFMYHGAEHKTINAYESDIELTVENVKNSTRFHKRCGTSFLVIVMIISIVVFLFIPTNSGLIRVLSRVILVPVIAGLSYEVIKWAGSHDNWFVNMISAPGIAMQFITTKEPDDSMIEVAIASLKAVIDEEASEDDN